MRRCANGSLVCACVCGRCGPWLRPSCVRASACCVSREIVPLRVVPEANRGPRSAHIGRHDAVEGCAAF